MNMDLATLLARALGRPAPDDDLDEVAREALACRAELIRDLRDDIHDARVLNAMLRVPRHMFAPRVSVQQAYLNRMVPIGYDQTMSQPQVVGTMTEALELSGDERVLEIGTGSGYHAAVLSTLAAEVFSLECVQELVDEARPRLRQLGYRNIHVRAGDGSAGWPEQAPFDRILVTSAAADVPLALLEQLGEGAILVAPVGRVAWSQRLLRYRKTDGGFYREDLGSVRFVPLVPGN